MLHSELEQFKHRMHHRVTITKNDGSTVDGYIQPWSETIVYLTPLENVTGQAIAIAISDIKGIEVTG